MIFLKQMLIFRLRVFSVNLKSKIHTAKSHFNHWQIWWRYEVIILRGRLARALRRPPRNGFWLDDEGRLYVGYLKSESNFHYGYIDTHGELMMTRSHYDYPKHNPLTPISFEDGVQRLVAQLMDT